ncbi:hypothetical protein MMC22_008312 [Lobaria immixta]|nr:hypothetical protein [Lobaria immixta]
MAATTSLLSLNSLKDSSYAITELIKGYAPSKGQRVVYADGAFDLFAAGHTALLKAVMSIERTQDAGLEPYLIVGIHDDKTVSKCKEIFTRNEYGGESIIAITKSI